MISCGNCGTLVDANDVTCPHCEAVLAAWVPAGDSEQSDTYHQPDYAKPPAHTPIFPAATAIDKATATNLVNTLHTMDKATALRLVSAIHAIDRVTAYRLVNVIHAYARKRAKASAPTRLPVNQPTLVTGDEPVRNIAFAIGAVLFIALLIMWGIVGAMVYSGTLSIEFVVIAIVLTLAFKPTMSSIRRVFQK